MPWMLLPRPFLLRRRHQPRKGYVNINNVGMNRLSTENGVGTEHHVIGNGDAYDGKESGSDLQKFSELLSFFWMSPYVEHTLGRLCRCCALRREHRK